MTAPTLHTMRLTLRAPTSEDLGAYQAFYAASDVKVGKYRGGRSDAEIQQILWDDIAHWNTNGFGMFLIVVKESGDIIGGSGIVHPGDWPRHELTWWLMPGTRGTGYATEASRAIIDWAYGTLGWPAVETHLRDENLPARRLAKRLGGQKLMRETFPDGVARDVFVLPKEQAA